MHRHLHSLAWLGLLLLVAACGNDRPSLATGTVQSDVAQTMSDGGPSAPEDLDTAVDLSWVATAEVDELEVYEQRTDEQPSLTMQNPTAVGGPLVFLVIFDTDEWVKVLLPVRPNGTTGWVRKDDVTMSYHQYRIEVTLDEFELEVFHRGESIFQTTVGVARDNAPTPGGLYYLTELIVPLKANSPYGPFAYGLSGFSETFESFNGGQGQLGLHGTNDPDSIGKAVSSGCVRLANDAIRHLAGFLPLGTPVEIGA
ncbi:MAG: L,D-transpeptidase [Acidobacteria bacterium]|nr:L,D-transpeptidase [Acidobacteriota bacterium]